MDTKQCTNCGIIKDINDFSPCKLGKFGKHSQCKVCRNHMRVVGRGKGRIPLSDFQLSKIDGLLKQKDSLERQLKVIIAKIEYFEKIKEIDHENKHKQPKT